MKTTTRIVLSFLSLVATPIVLFILKYVFLFYENFAVWLGAEEKEDVGMIIFLGVMGTVVSILITILLWCKDEKPSKE